MKSHPSVPHIDDTPPEFLGRGHLWLQELLDGAPFRFQLQDSGQLRVGARDQVFRDDDVPLAYIHAVRHVREKLDRDALRSAVDDVESVVFFGYAMHRQSVDYEWHRTPSVLGTDIWDADHGALLPPDSVEHVFDRLGLEPVNTIRKEVRAVDFQPESAEFPTSGWRDGPVAGLLVRNKTGERAKLPNPAIATERAPEPLTGSAEELAERYASSARLQRIASQLESQTGYVTFEALFDRVFEEVLREIHARLTHSQTTVEVSEFRSAMAARTQAWLGDD